VRSEAEQSNTPEMVLPIQSGKNLFRHALLAMTGFKAVEKMKIDV